jgi:hypothetical protein
MAVTPRHLLPLALALVAWAALPPSGRSCPFCTMQGQTLTNEVDQASMVLYGRLANAKLSGNGSSEGTTDLQIERVVKKHDVLGDKKVITLDRYVPTDTNDKSRYLVFCDVFKGKVDPYRGLAVKADSDIAQYLSGAMKVKGKDVATRLRYFFNYLDSADLEISNDAYKEFGNASYTDYRDLAKSLPPDRIAKWLRDPNTPAFRYGLYASMLGHCGKPEHAALLRSMLDDQEKRVGTGVDGILAGYVMLQPKEGWEYLHRILKDPRKDFTFRYAALRTVRFLWDSRPDLVERKKVRDGLMELVEQPDVADLAIEDLRKWHEWGAADRILDLDGAESHNIPIVHRAILRYALSYPKADPNTSRAVEEQGKTENAEALTQLRYSRVAAFLEAQRKKDARAVQDAEELLKLETNVAPPKK